MKPARLPQPGRRSRLAVGWLGLGMLLLAPGLPAQASTPIRQVQEMMRAPAGRANQGRPVQIKGMVLFHEPAEKLLVIGDDTGSVLVESTGQELGLAPGQAVSVQGVTGLALGTPAVVQGAVSTRAGHQQLTPLPVDMAEVVAGRLDYQFVELEGLVTTVTSTRGRTMLHLHHGEFHMNAPIRDQRFEEAVDTRYQDARVRVRGVVVPYRRPSSGEAGRTALAISSQDDIVLLAPGTAPDFDVPATPIDHVPRITTECRIRIAGRVTQTMTNRSVQVGDDSGRIRLRLDNWITVRDGDHVEALGYPTLEEDEPVLDHCVLRILEPRRVPPAAPGSGGPPLVPVLRSIAEIVALQPGNDGDGLPVRFQATVTGCAPHLNTVFLQGSSNALRAVMAATGRRASSLRPGQIVEVSGYTALGGFLPHLVEARMVNKARGSLPLPRELSYDVLASGQHDSERIAIRGVVRGVRADGPLHVVEVAASGGKFPILLPAGPSNAPPAHLVDAEVLVRGVCLVIPNQHRQARGFEVHVADLADIRVERAPAPDPFQLEPHRIADLFRYNQHRTPGHRTRIQGTVTLQRNPDAFYLRGQTASIRVELANPVKLHPGDFVEVVGFPVLRDNQARLEDAILKVTGRTNVPVPKVLAAGANLDELAHADEWVSLEGRLLEVRKGPKLTTLALQSDQQFFEARLLEDAPSKKLGRLERGALVRVTGICQLRYDESGHLRFFNLLAASPDAITVLRSGPWLTTGQAGIVLVSLLTVVLAALAWVTLLRRTVRKQTSVILDLNANLERRVTERTMELEAANRELESFSYSVSHDLRAPLRAVNGFAEVLLQTHGPQLDERGSRYLRQVAEGGRRMGRLVDDLLTFSRLGRQPVNRAPVDLYLLARKVLDELPRQQPGRQVEVRLQPMPPALGDRTLLEQALINLLGNAWKFTGRRPDPLIEVGATTQGGQPVYFVRDNGAGFDLKYADKLFGVFQRLHPEDEFPGTGVGLAIVQRIIHRHGGRIWAQARPGEGATFFFTLPCPPTGARPPVTPAAETAQAFGK